MNTKIFVNLPVKDLNKSMEFFRKLGFDFDLRYADDTATCMVVSEDIYVMLLTEKKFSEFVPNEICDTTRRNEVIVALTYDSRKDVDDLVEKAVAAGGTAFKDAYDYGTMYGRSFRDLDNHIWEVFYIDPDAYKE